MAENQFKKGWSHGDIASLINLLGAYLLQEKCSYISYYLKDILNYKDNNLELSKILMIYSLCMNPPSKELFLKASDGFKDEQIINNTEISKFFLIGIKGFGLRDYRTHLRKKIERINKN